MARALVIGGGPAGLMAAEELALAGHEVTIAEAKPTVARKFLMAGKSGLNVTKAEPLPDFVAQYDSDWLSPMLAEFGPADVQDWCAALGQEVFTGSSGRVFPKTMKGSPLLRSWLARLSGLGVQIKTRWRWEGWQDEEWLFATPDGPQTLAPRVVVLALGGASWSRLGSDGAWTSLLHGRGVSIADFRPANMGFVVDWSVHMTPHFGTALKGIELTAGKASSRGEIVISARGLEGGGIYAISRALRDGAPLQVDLMPDVPRAEFARRIQRLKSSDSLGNRLRKLGLAAPAAALLQEFGRALPLEQALKALPVRLQGPRPIDEAISVAGGVMRSAVTEGLELAALPGVFVCGEMLDWEAPTGGYLLTGCWATGRWAGRAAVRAI